MNGDSRLPRIERSSMGEQAYEILKESIFSSRFMPGQKLDLSTIARQMGVSRTPLKDAVRRLADDGLVEIVPHSGTYVTALGRRDIEESFDVRKILEVHAIGLAGEFRTEAEVGQLRDIVREMQRAVNANDRTRTYKRYTELDRAFHQVLVDSSRNKRLLEAWEQINVHVQMARIRYRRTDRDLDLSMSQHERIAEAFSSGDSSQLRGLMGQHIDAAKLALLRDLDELEGAGHPA